jgi:hypothetical protein
MGNFIALSRKKVASDFLGWHKKDYLVVCGHGTVSKNSQNCHR